MRQTPGVGLGCLLMACAAAWGSAPGERIRGEDIVLQIPRLADYTMVAVDPIFDYASCDTFPAPVDLRCGLLATSQFDAEGRQYATRYTNSQVSGILPRTEIWRSRPDGGSELVAYLEPRDAGSGIFDDGRMERIAVDPVRGQLLILLTTSCYPPGAPACTYGQANEVIAVLGLKTLAEAIVGTLQGGTGRGVVVIEPLAADAPIPPPAGK